MNIYHYGKKNAIVPVRKPTIERLPPPPPIPPRIKEQLVATTTKPSSVPFSSSSPQLFQNQPITSPFTFTYSEPLPLEIPYHKEKTNYVLNRNGCFLFEKDYVHSYFQPIYLEKSSNLFFEKAQISFLGQGSFQVVLYTHHDVLKEGVQITKVMIQNSVKSVDAPLRNAKFKPGSHKIFIGIIHQGEPIKGILNVSITAEIGGPERKIEENNYKKSTPSKPKGPFGEPVLI